MPAPSSEQNARGPSANKPKDRRRASLGLKLVLAGASLGFAGLVAEIGWRFVQYRQETTLHEQWAQVAAKKLAEKPPSGTVNFSELIYPSPAHDVIYELCPNLDVVYLGGKVTTNSDGFRGAQVPKDKPDDVFRIVGLGDSVMFGMCNNDGEEYLQIMADRLRKARPDRKIEIVNTSIPGHNTAMEVALLESKGLAWKPDLVVIDFVRNDFSLPNFIVGKTDFLALNRSFLWEWICSLNNERGGFESDPELVPPEYSHLVGHAGFKNALRRLKELSLQHGFKVVVTTHRYKVPVVLETCKELGLPLIFGETAVSEYEKEHNISAKTYLGSELTVSDRDPHPSALQHRILGEYYAKMLLATNLLD